MLGLDQLQNLRDRLELREQLEVELLLMFGESFNGHCEAVHLIQRGDDLACGLAAPRVKKIFGKGAIPLRKGRLPGDVMQRHRINNGAVAVEEIGAEVAGGELKFHAAQPPSPGFVGSIRRALLKRLK